MKSTLKVLGATLDQVAAISTERLGQAAVSPVAGALAAAIALAAAMAPVQEAHADAVFSGGAVVGGGAYSGGRTVGGLVSEHEGQASSSANTVGRVVGGVGGAVLGDALTKGQGGLLKVVGVLGGAFLGHKVGDALTKSEDERTTYDVRNPNAPGGQVKMTRAAYQDALNRASSPYPSALPAGSRAVRQLEPETHAGLYRLITDAAAQRIAAAQAGAELDRAEMALAVNPADKASKQKFSLANQAYRVSFDGYAAAYRQMVQAVSLGERSGYDVSSHRALMSLIPPDIRQAAAVDVSSWPGVNSRLAELSSPSPSATVDELQAVINAAQEGLRPRQR